MKLIEIKVEAHSGKVVESITASLEHPFFVEGQGFVPAGQLALGNAIVTRAGPNLIVKAVQTQSRAEGYTVYNLVVEDDHTYFVGKHSGGVWVHNANCNAIAARITAGFGNLKCQECAEALMAAFKKAGINGELIEIKGAGGFEYIVSDTAGETAISENGRHLVLSLVEKYCIVYYRCLLFCLRLTGSTGGSMTLLHIVD